MRLSHCIINPSVIGWEKRPQRPSLFPLKGKENDQRARYVCVCVWEGGVGIIKLPGTLPPQTKSLIDCEVASISVCM